MAYKIPSCLLFLARFILQFTMNGRKHFSETDLAQEAVRNVTTRSSVRWSRSLHRSHGQRVIPLSSINPSIHWHRTTLAGKEKTESRRVQSARADGSVLWEANVHGLRWGCLRRVTQPFLFPSRKVLRSVSKRKAVPLVSGRDPARSGKEWACSSCPGGNGITNMSVGLECCLMRENMTRPDNASKFK